MALSLSVFGWRSPIAPYIYDARHHAHPYSSIPALARGEAQLFYGLSSPSLAHAFTRVCILWHSYNSYTTRHPNFSTWLVGGVRGAPFYQRYTLTLVFDDGLHQCSRQGTLLSICRISVAHKRSGGSPQHSTTNYDVTAHTDYIPRRYLLGVVDSYFFRAREIV